MRTAVTKVLEPLQQSAAHSLRRQEVLERYFAEDRFHFANPNHKDALRKAMETVYLQQKPLVCVDVEAYERSTKKITEIGISTYDPTEQGDALMPEIHTVHVVIREHKRMLNGRFVPNHKFNSNSGVLYEMSLKELQIYVSKIMSHFLTERGGAIVGHDVKGDLQWLSRLGVERLDQVAAVDTMRLFLMSRRLGLSLRGILRFLDIPHAYLHNAANDAYYTLFAAMCYCDPYYRRKYNLDVYQDNEVALSLAKGRKFSDKSVMQEGHLAPSFGAQLE